MNTPQEFFFVRRDKRYEQVRFADILYVKGKKGYIQIVTEQQTFLVMNTLTKIVKYLPPEQFCRIHHSYIVSLSRIKAFDRAFVQLHPPPPSITYKKGLAECTELPVGFAYRSKLRASVTILMNKNGNTSGAVRKARWDLEVEEEVLEE